MFKERPQAGPESGLEGYASKIEKELGKAKELVERRNAGEKIIDFDIRGRLYALAGELAPHARDNDIEAMHERLHLKGNERVVDLAAGTGLFTKQFLGWTKGEVIAVDPSRQALQEMEKVCDGKAKAIVGSPDDASTMNQINPESVDIVSSFGGLHHVPDQRMMMEQVARILKPHGRFVAGDVGDGTDLAKHFDEVVAEKCLTGHTAQWLSEKKLKELIAGLPLKLEKAEDVPLTWVFNSERELALFFKGMHAYDMPDAEILLDLKNELGYEWREGKLHLNWPMLLFSLRKE